MIKMQRESLHWIARYSETQLEKARGKAELSHKATGLTQALAECNCRGELYRTPEA